MSEIGHNSEEKALIKRILNVMQEQDTLAEDLKELKAEGKGKGLDMKAIALAVKEHRSPIEKELKTKANIYFRESGGNYDLFAEQLMRTKEWIRAELRARLGSNESMPPFTAIETLMCERIDRLMGIPVKQLLRPHEEERFKP